VNELATAFARTSGYKVTVLQEMDKPLEQRLSNGPADLITGNPPATEVLLKKGQVVAGTVTPFMLAGLGVSVRAGAPKPDIGTVDAYAKTLLAAKSIGYSRGCSGQHVAQGIAQLGLTEQLKPKIVLTGGGTGPVTFFLARGDFELGIQQSNIMGRAGDRLCRACARIREHTLSRQRRSADGFKGAGGRTGNDQVHGVAGGRAAPTQGA
jgi:molybdate transport system substrate-binding protein